MKTFSAKAKEIVRKWYVVDASDQVLGRVATKVVQILRGKHKPEYTPHADTGDYVIIINADKIRVTGNKATDKIYHHNTGYPGGLKSVSFEKLLDRHPEKVLELAIQGMLPKNSLGREVYRKLKVYAGNTHEHQAQQPELLEINA